MTTAHMHSSSTRPLQPKSKDDHVSKRQVDSIMSQVGSPMEQTSSDTIEYVNTSVFTAPSAPPSTLVIVSTVTPTGAGENPSIVTVIRTFTPLELPDLPSDTSSITSSVASELVPVSSTTKSLASSTRSSDSASASHSSDDDVSSAFYRDDGSGTARTADIIASIAIGLLAIGFPTSTKNDDEIGRDTDGDAEIPELETMELPQELPEDRPTRAQESNTTRSSKYATDASHELTADSATAELLNGQGEHTPLVTKHDPQRPAAGIMETTNNTLSSNVEAQRRREVEWPEMEEERIRKRRELLAAQGGANS
ncbi:hypothetical protein BKA58DRAFT_469069 [Alternaria rosae]|uniref:uncharacterized protein n=1 Tax=Alternaria rosae TaxID=1187941 RepID=UPI001E8DE0D5|nr:uncharacterized protein BKA58DRAFT_469069 [Alternaria rosae]KAH6869961.1 hypothetical protein BKA58DRAFT_469069 [Alternaria rosae]